MGELIVGAIILFVGLAIGILFGMVVGAAVERASKIDRADVDARRNAFFNQPLIRKDGGW